MGLLTPRNAAGAVLVAMFGTLIVVAIAIPEPELSVRADAEPTVTSSTWPSVTPSPPAPYVPPPTLPLIHPPGPAPQPAPPLVIEVRQAVEPSAAAPDEPAPVPDPTTSTTTTTVAPVPDSTTTTTTAPPSDDDAATAVRHVVAAGLRLARGLPAGGSDHQPEITVERADVLLTVAWVLVPEADATDADAIAALAWDEAAVVVRALLEHDVAGPLVLVASVPEPSAASPPAEVLRVQIASDVLAGIDPTTIDGPALAALVASAPVS